MNFAKEDKPLAWPILAWLAVAIAGVAAPAMAMLLLVNAPENASLVFVGGVLLAVGLMGAAMIGAAAARRLWVGLMLAVLTGACLIMFAQALGMPALLHPLSTALAIVVAAFSFAARGALFAKSAAGKGWLIAVAVVAGEAAVVLTALADPDLWPDWLLALLPAEWATIAIQTALTGTGTLAASSTLLALVGTAAATLLVAKLWPSRWPYLIMFAAWLGFAALVYHRPGPLLPSATSTASIEPAGYTAAVAPIPVD